MARCLVDFNDIDPRYNIVEGNGAVYGTMFAGDCVNCNPWGDPEGRAVPSGGRL